MGLQRLANRLCDRDRIGLTPELADRLGIRAADATRGMLMAEEDDDHGHLGVYLLGAYVVDDTDTWGDGEIYWWSIPTLVDRAGKACWGPTSGLPTGGAPHKVGSLEWMTSLSLRDPPLLAVIPPDDDILSCVLRLGFYDDDGEVADVARALGAGLEVLSGLPREVPAGPEGLIAPVRKAIYEALKADDDDILLDGDVILRRGEATRFGAGLVGSEVNAMVRVYYLVRDERATESFGPVVMHRGQVETVRFETPLATGGRLAIFTRGADVGTTAFGTLTAEMPFVNKVLDAAAAEALSAGFNLNGTGAAKVAAFYTPPPRAPSAR